MLFQRNIICYFFIHLVIFLTDLTRRDSSSLLSYLKNYGSLSYFNSVTAVMGTNFPGDGKQYNHRMQASSIIGSMAALRDSLDDGNILRVIEVLENNIKQWSFIESQLLEPNVNLGMPEIFIPLRHLTTTLEVLGNIFYIKEDYGKARDCLERACPLMELLPDDEMGFSDLEESSRRYAVGCFSLLKEVYLKIFSGIKTQKIIGHRVMTEPDEYSDDSYSDDTLWDESSRVKSGTHERDIESKFSDLRSPFDHLRDSLENLGGGFKQRLNQIPYQEMQQLTQQNMKHIPSALLAMLQGKMHSLQRGGDDDVGFRSKFDFEVLGTMLEII